MEELNIFESKSNKDETWVQPPIGKGKCKKGQRKKWKKNLFFEQDLLEIRAKELGKDGFLQMYAAYTPSQVASFFEKIKQHVIRPKETFVHARNKLLLWLDRSHNQLGWNQCSRAYKIGRSTAKGYVRDVERGILNAFRGTDVIKWPSESEKKQMVEILKLKNAPMPQVPLSLDGKHARCLGKHHTERSSWKLRFQPCFNCLFIIERVFGTVVAFNLDKSARKHDIRVLRESEFYQNLDEIMDGWYILADKGYIGVDVKSVVPAMDKKKMKQRKRWPKLFWKQFNDARNDSERTFSHFFYNKFSTLGNWQGKSQNTFVEWSSCVVCCIIMWNYLKISK